MATTPVRMLLPPGLGTLALRLYPIDSTTADHISSVAESSVPGRWTWSVTQALTGDYEAVVYNTDGNVVAGGRVRLADTEELHWIGEAASQASVDGLAASVDGVASEETLQKVLSKVNLLKAGLNVQYPFVSATGTIVLFEGFDFTDAGNAAIQVTEAEVGQFDPTRMDIGSFQFYMRSQSSNDDYLGTATATKNADLWTLKAEIESEELPMKIGMYDWWFIATEVGTGDSDHFGIVHGTLELRRGMKVTC